MRSLIIVLLLALYISAAAEQNPVPADPDFGWGAKCSAKVRVSLELAQKKWREAASVPSSPDCLRSKTSANFDERYLRELLGRANESSVGYTLLDAAMRKQKSLDECNTLYAKSVSAASSTAPESSRHFDDSYYYLKSYIRLAIGLARALIAKQMTASQSSGYCFQAMEAAIDALRDAADDSCNVPGGAKRAESIRKLRSGLFEVWERAQRSKDTKPIDEIEILRVFDESGLLACIMRDKMEIPR